MPFLKRDFVMRQIQRLTQLLQQIIFKKKQNKHQEAKQQLQDAFQGLTKDHPKSFEELNLSETLQLFTRNEKFESRLAIAVADLLVEEAEILRDHTFTKSQKSYAQALLLYKRALKDQSAPIPVDIQKKMQDIRSILSASEKVGRINDILKK